MSEGIANIAYSTPQGQTAAGGGAGPIIAANNGLSLSTLAPSTVVLGQNIAQAGNPANLLSAREIPLNGFALRITRVTATDFIQFNPDPGNDDWILLQTGIRNGFERINFTNNNVGNSAAAGFLFSNGATILTGRMTSAAYTAGNLPPNSGCFTTNAPQGLFSISFGNGGIQWAVSNGSQDKANTMMVLSILGNLILTNSNYTPADNTNKLQVAGKLNTGGAAPLTLGAGNMDFGKIVTAASVLNATKYLEMSVDGVLVKVCIN